MAMRLSEQFASIWAQSDSPPDVFSYLQQHPDSTCHDVLAVVLADQRYRWKTNRPQKVEDYLERLPQLAGDPEIKLQLAVGEFQARLESEDHASIDEFAGRFPEFSDALRIRLLDLKSETADVNEFSRTRTFILEAPSSDFQLGRYRILRVLGQGGYGRVYLAYDEQLQREIAVKVPMLQQFQQPEDADLYLAEARTVASLNHPNILPVYDTGRTDDGSIYIVSKYIEGSTLSDMIVRDRPSHEDSAKLMATVARALHHAHERRLIHRDVKPGNILLEESTGTPYVADFGLAIREEDYFKNGKVAGTPAYMSPEQARGEGHRLDGRSDLFSLGIILYQMLTGRRPFRGSTPNELFNQIISVDPRPPRELNDSIPAELERICLKALSKRAADRYATGREMADDLLHWNAPPEPQARGVQIVPKGLRSFDADDADFFVDLLPGPRNRNGLPESIQFWKSRVEEVDPDKTFTVGLIYGPSGCGKSSLVKAGIIPLLSGDVTTLYVEATPDETEIRILRGLRKQVPKLPEDLGLVEAFAFLRRAEGRKVLVILDQFEQWLHTHRAEQETDLVTALRQCDGGQLQAIVMVRDDFSMAAYRFMQELETRIVEGHNFVTVDLFDLDHAKKVLIKFGQAFGKLPSRDSRLTEEEREFVASVASRLAQDGKVVSVRLALFAEMIKGKPWKLSTLQDVGGTEGVGVSFLEETFCSRDANPTHRLHEEAARDVLKALLPEVGSDIKGNMRSHVDLLQASGYPHRPGDFNELLRILDGELRLITPTDPKGFRTASGSSSDTQFYQLTHDYLVSSLREWLTRKQQQTKRGRAELKLDERSSLWNDKPESRNLPSWWEWVNLAALTDRTKWTEGQRDMMSRARRYHGTRWGISAVIVLVLVLGIQKYRSTVDARLKTQEQESARKQASLLIDSMTTVPATAVPFAIEDLERYAEEAVGLLHSKFASDAVSPDEKLRCAFALAALEDVQHEFLIHSIEWADADECSNIVLALRHDEQTSVRLLTQRARGSTAEKPESRRAQSKWAICLLHFGEPAIAEERLISRGDPLERSDFIETFGEWHGRIDQLIPQIPGNHSPDFRSGLSLGLGRIDVDDLSQQEVQLATDLLSAWHREQRDSGTHSATKWALQQWGRAVPIISPPVSDRREYDWYQNSLNMTMIRVPPGSEAGDEGVVLDADIWIGDREVSRSQFDVFANDEALSRIANPDKWEGADPRRSPTLEHPMQKVSWDDAVLFCNWLSQRENLQPCYTQTDQVWKLDMSAHGYRLPLESEWERACRAGTSTDFCFGNELSFLPQYAVYRSNHTQVCGSKMPNAWGLFDMHGNVYEWCHELRVKRSRPDDDEEREWHVLRGGAFDYDSEFAKSDYDQKDGERHYRSFTIGFRVVRTIPPGE